MPAVNVWHVERNVAASNLAHGTHPAPTSLPLASKAGGGGACGGGLERTRATASLVVSMGKPHQVGSVLGSKKGNLVWRFMCNGLLFLAVSNHDSRQLRVCQFTPQVGSTPQSHAPAQLRARVQGNNVPASELARTRLVTDRCAEPAALRDIEYLHLDRHAAWSAAPLNHRAAAVGESNLTPVSLTGHESTKGLKAQ
jgi:hypothetical protein